MHVEEACATWHFSMILIRLRVEVAQISDFKFTTLYTGQERHSFYFFISN